MTDDPRSTPIQQLNEIVAEAIAGIIYFADGSNGGWAHNANLNTRASLMHHRILFCVFIGLILTLDASHASARPPTAPALAANDVAIDQFITDQMAAQRISGLALAITHGDHVSYLKGYGSG